MRPVVDRLLEHMKASNRQVKEMEAQIKAWHEASDLSRKLAAVPGIGPLTAGALVTSIADARSCKNGRQVAAWLGLVPKQDSSGGEPKLLGMSKRGDTYLRTLLIHGGRSTVVAAQRWEKPNPWLQGLLTRRHPGTAAVALANKNARTVWALLAHEWEFRADYVPRPPLA